MKTRKLLVGMSAAFVAIGLASCGSVTKGNDMVDSPEGSVVIPDQGNKDSTENGSSTTTPGDTGNNGGTTTPGDTGNNNDQSSETSKPNDKIDTPNQPSIDKGNSELEVIEASGSLESAYVEFSPVESASGYNAYIKAEGASTFTKLDKELLRKYNSYYRVDAVGLRAGKYEMKVCPVIDGLEKSEVVIKDITVLAHDRSGFAFSSQSPTKGDASGAYNADGTLKSGAQVIYVTGSTAKTVSATVNGGKVTGLQAILAAKQKATANEILDIRIVGMIKASDMDSLASSAEGLQIKGAKGYQNMNITIEGIGEDATISGFGFLIRNCANVELRNFAIMNCMDDSVSVDTDNSNLWIHNLDLFYGQTGGANDQAKGDGTIDLKCSQYLTVSYNHYWDSGKASLLDAGSKSADSCVDYVSMHHNWFDHSDSRHPRCRNGQNFHIYNNYYDGVAKYGIGSAVGASVFSEGNYFRNCKYPYLIGTLGSEAGQVLSGEKGGMIKAYGDYIEGAKATISYQSNNTSYDYYQASSRNEKITGITNAFGNTYSNFDTSSSMYEYNVDTAETAKERTMMYAGRINGGDFQYDFSSITYQQKDGNGTMQTVSADEYYGVDTNLKSLIQNYTSSIVKTYIDGSSTNTTPQEPTTPDTDEPTTPDTPTTGGDNVVSGTVVTFNSTGASSSSVTIGGSITNGKGSYTLNGETLENCLKMDSKGSISFTLTKETKVTFIIKGKTAGNTLTIGNQTITTTASIDEYEFTLAAGTYNLAKDDGESYVFAVIFE